MKLKSLLAKPFASYVYKQIRRGMSTAVEDQQKIFEELIKGGALTAFGKDHKLSEVKTYEEYKQSVRIRDYEEFKPYIQQIKEGKHHVLWKGQPIYPEKNVG